MKRRKSKETNITIKRGTALFSVALSVALVASLMVPSFAHAEKEGDADALAGMALSDVMQEGTAPAADPDATTQGDATAGETQLQEGPSAGGLELSASAGVPAAPDVAAAPFAADGSDVSWYSEGESSFSISNAAQLKGLAKLVNGGNTFSGKTVNLTADVDLGGNQWTPIGVGGRSDSSFVGKPFMGTFSGGDHTISGLTITEPQGDKNYAHGLFGGVVGGTIQNFTLSGVNVNVSTSELAGGAIGMLTGGGTASGITVSSGSISAVRGNGAIVGRLTLAGTITGCTNYASVSGTGANVGGIVGAAYYTAAGQTPAIRNCVNYGAVTGTIIGGIVGLSTGDISGCTNNGTITAIDTAETYAGGIAGEQHLYGTISGNTNNAQVFGSLSGGIIGWVRYNDSSAYGVISPVQVLNNVNTARIVGSSVGYQASGGIVGLIHNYAEVHGNINSAPSISGGNFVAGIVGGIQVEEKAQPSGLGAPNVTVSGNQSSTSRANLSGACVDLYAYNNDSTVFKVYNNICSDPVASVDGNLYGSIQEAIDVVAGTQVTAPTDFTILIKDGTHIESPKIIQQLNKNITLKPEEGAAVTINGQIVVDGGGNVNADIELLDRPEKVVIDGLAINSTTDACVFITKAIDSPSTGSMRYYTHNVTVSNCTFSGGTGTAGIRIGGGVSNDSPAVSNIAVSNCLLTSGMHSLLQASALVRGLEVSGCTVDGSDAETRGINVLVVGEAIISGNNFKNCSGYALRMGSGNSNVALLPCKVQITGNDFSISSVGSSSDEGLIVLRGYAPDSITIKDNISLVAGKDISQLNNTNGASANSYNLDLTGNYWGSSGFSLENVVGLADNASLIAGNYITHTTFDANGGTFADGGGTVASNATVTFDASKKTLTAVTFPIANPTQTGKVFAGWYTDATGGAKVEATGNANMPADVTLYAHWAEAEVLNETTGASYASLAEAISAAGNGDALKLLKDTTVSSSIMIDAGKAITLDGSNGAGGKYVITGAGNVGTASNAPANSLFIVQGGLSLENVSIENVGIGIRAAGAASKIDVASSSISAHYYGISLRNVNQELTVADSVLTGWACIMTSAGDLTAEQKAASTGSSIIVSNTQLNGVHRSVEQYGAITLQQSYNGVSVSITGGSINLGWTGKVTDLAYYSAINVRAYDSTITVDGTAIDVTASFPEATKGQQGVVLATMHPDSAGTAAADTSVILKNVGYSNKIAENAKVAFKRDGSPATIRNDVAVTLDGIGYVPASDDSGVGVPQTLQVSAANIVATYNGASHAVTPVTASNVDATVEDATVLYYNDQTKAYDLDSAPTFKDVTNGAQEVKFQASKEGYVSAIGSATVTVNPVSLTLTSATASRTYDGTPLTNTDIAVTEGSFVEGETPTYTVTGTITNAGDVPNEFTWTFPSGVKATNYSITKVVGILTVSKADLDVRVSGKTDSKVFTGSTLKVEGFTADHSDKATVSLKNGATAVAQGTAVGSYPMGLTKDSFSVNSANYNVNLIFVADGKLVIMEETIEKQIEELSKDSTPEKVNHVVENLTNASQETLDQMTTEEGLKQVKELEELYIDKNDGRIGSTVLDVPKDIVTSASASGAALSVPLDDGMELHAQVLVVEATPPEKDVIPDSINPDNLISFDVSLNILDEDDNVVQESIQPKAPLTLTLTVSDPEPYKLDVDRLRVVHYHDGGVEIVIPSNVTRSGDDVTVTFTLTSLSPVLLANTESDLTVAADNVQVSYDGKAYGVTAHAYIDGTLDESATIKYYNEVTQLYELDASPTFSNVTNGSQTVQFQASKQGYTAATGSATVTISAAKITVTVTGNTSTQTYSGSLYSVDGFTADNTDKATVALKDGVAAHAEGTQVGTYAMGLTTDSFNVRVLDSNYDVTLAVNDGWLKINAKATPASGGGKGGSGKLAATSDSLPVSSPSVLIVGGLASLLVLLVVSRRMKRN